MIRTGNNDTSVIHSPGVKKAEEWFAGTKEKYVCPGNGRLLGLGKTESYYLVNKNWFKVITIGGKMRVMTDSFEEWYAGQNHYKKKDAADC